MITKKRPRFLDKTKRLDPYISPKRKHIRNLLNWYNHTIGASPAKVFEKSEAPLKCVTLNKNGNLLAAAGEDGTLFYPKFKIREKSFIDSMDIPGCSASLIPSSEGLANQCWGRSKDLFLVHWKWAKNQGMEGTVKNNGFNLKLRW